MNEIFRKANMHKKDKFYDTRAFWNRVADDWEIQVGDDGDSNRMMNSDPVLWKFVGNVAGLDILDAGCGTGYLTRKLQKRGANVIGIDFAENMIEIARYNAPKLDFRVDSCSELKTIDDNSIDLLVANYVLMDTPDLTGTMKAFSRVLRTNGYAVVIFSHPCFPQGRATSSANTDSVQYHWESSYFEQRKFVDPPWAHFKSDFIWFHRPLSDYWKAFKANGFDVIELEEPRVTRERYHLANSERNLKNGKTRPYSIAFKLQKKG